MSNNQEKILGMPPFLADFLMGVVSGAVSKTAAAPIERGKLLIQNQDEMIKAGRLARHYDGIVAKNVAKALFNGAGANILRGVAGAGALSIYDGLQLVLFGKAFKG